MIMLITEARILLYDYSTDLRYARAEIGSLI